MPPSISPLCEGSVRLPLLSSGDSGAFVSVCARASSCAHRRFFASDPCVISSILPRSLHTERTLVFVADRRALFFFRFSFRKLNTLPRAQFAGQRCFICFRLSSGAFCVVAEWTLLYLKFGKDFLETRMDSLRRCGEEKHNKESFNLQLSDCQHADRSAAGGATS